MILPDLDIRADALRRWFYLHVVNIIAWEKLPERERDIWRNNQRIIDATIAADARHGGAAAVERRRG